MKDDSYSITRFMLLSVGFYGISNFVGYLTPNQFLCRKSVLFKTIQFSMNTLFNCQKHFYFKLFSLFKRNILFAVLFYMI